MSNLLDDLNAVRARNGQDLINPFAIQGFEEGSPPLPPLDMERIEAANPASHLSAELLAEPDPTPGPPPSPLVMLGEAKEEPKEAPQPSPFQAGVLPLDPDLLLVMGGQASFKGQAVELSETDQAAVARIVLESAQRRLREQLDQVRKAAPRRIRAARPADPIPPVVKRKPGRPSKVLPAS